MSKEQKTLNEIFTSIQEAKTRAERIEILKQNDSFSLRTVLQLNYDSGIKLDLPKGKPPFAVNEAPAGQLDKTIKRIGYCVVNSSMSKLKKESNFISILESVSEEDANIICRAKDKKIEKLFSRVSESLVKSVFPTLVK
jgi:hypothetical protein